MDNCNKVQELQFRRLSLCDYIGGDMRIKAKAVAKDLRDRSEL